MSEYGKIISIAPLWFSEDGESDEFLDEEVAPQYVIGGTRHRRQSEYNLPSRFPQKDDTANKSFISNLDNGNPTSRITFSCSPCCRCGTRVNILIWVFIFLFASGFGVGFITPYEFTDDIAMNGSQSQLLSSAPNEQSTIVPSSNLSLEQTISNRMMPSQAPTKFFVFDSEATVKPDDSFHDGLSNPLDALLDDDDINDYTWTTQNSDYLVGVYYPWYGNDFHRGDGYIRKLLQPPQTPALGEYDDTKSQTIAQHLKWSRQANIGLWVTSWWGPNYREDRTTRDIIMEHMELGNMKIALHYETEGRIKHNKTSGDTDLSELPGDIKYICNRYFSHPSYYRINDRPVLVIYLTRQLEAYGVLEETMETIRNTTNQHCSQDIYIIGDHIFGDAPTSLAHISFSQLDAVTNYDVYGSIGRQMRYAGTDGVDKYYKEQQKWQSLAIAHGCSFVPASSPGYNDRGVRLESDHPPLSRRLSVDTEEGSLFRYQLEKAKKLVDPMIDNLILVNSFNEWHEDTQIEPAVGSNTTLPINLTGGFQYNGYGKLYLNILRESTVHQNDNIFKNN